VDYTLNIYKGEKSEISLLSLSSDTPYMAFKEGELITIYGPDKAKGIYDSKILRISHVIICSDDETNHHEMNIWIE
jgi:hypothetical protein